MANNYQRSPELIAAMPRIIGDAPIAFIEKLTCPSCQAAMAYPPESDLITKMSSTGEVGYARRKFSS